jgi:Zn-finger nucleic acid-binding protein
MQCPSCSSSSLKLTKLEDQLPARECLNCHGILLDLLTYRAWAEKQPHPTKSHTTQCEVEDNGKALICPKCSKLMLKFRITGEKTNTIDVCTNCDDAWLDKGEWTLLSELSLQKKLNRIFTDPWQRQIRKDIATKSLQQRNKALLGEEDYTKLLQIKDWIAQHEKKHDLLRILTRELQPDLF